MSAFNEYEGSAQPYKGVKRDYYATRLLLSQQGMPVYFVEDKEKNQYVLKQFQSQTKCEREKRILKTLDDTRYVVKLVDKNADDSPKCFIVMEKLDGTLYDFEPNSIEELFEVFEKAFDALDYIHSKGVAHLDLHFDNFMTLRRGYRLEVKIIDFERSVDKNAKSSFKYDETIVVEQIQDMVEKWTKKYDEMGKPFEAEVMRRAWYQPSRYSQEDHRKNLMEKIEEARRYKRSRKNVK